MKTNLLCLLLGLTLAASLHQAAAQPYNPGSPGTAFTYEGKLNFGTNPATGSYDLTFTLFDALTGGTQQGVSITNLATGVTNGLFTLALDFGNQFPGASRWLEVAVRTNNAPSFTILSPREALLPTPYAIYAESAAISSSVSNAAITAAALNTVGAPTSGQVLSYTGSGLSWITPIPNGGLTLPYSGSASSGSSIFTLQNTGSGPVGVFQGNVGIGTTTPAAKLHIYGNAAPGAHIPSTEAVLASGDGYHDSFMSVYGDNAVTLDMWNGLYGEVSTYNYATAQGLPLVLNSNGGNVGIGTTSPQNQLDVLLSTPAANLSYNSSQGTSAVKGTYVPSGAYGALGYTYQYYPIQIAMPPEFSAGPSGVKPNNSSTQTITYGVYGNGGTGDYAGWFDGPVELTGPMYAQGASFNGQVAASSIRSPGAGINTATFAFTQLATSVNTQGNGTKIFNSICDGDPNAILIITHNWGADTNSTSQFNTKPVGVYYNSSIAHWVILNEDNSTMALGRAFNVMVIKP
jgi:hypothetical protein